MTNQIKENLFNLLRYPITIEFREEDLERLPTKVFYSWWLWVGDSVIGFNYARNQGYLPSPYSVSIYINHNMSEDDKIIIKEELCNMIMDIDNEFI